MLSIKSLMEKLKLKTFYLPWRASRNLYRRKASLGCFRFLRWMVSTSVTSQVLLRGCMLTPALFKRMIILYIRELFMELMPTY